MSPGTVMVADLGIGNIHSIDKALTRVGAKVEVASDAARWVDAKVLVLPGVGRFGAGSRALEPVRQELALRLQEGTPCLGICLGMQLLYESSQESPGAAGLGVIQGQIVALGGQDAKVPHTGWSRIRNERKDPLLEPNAEPYVYFVHSYAASAEARGVVATAEHGGRFAAVVRQGNTVGTQFHPEKSGQQGLRFLQRFLETAEAQA